MDLALDLVQRPDQLKTKLDQVINQLYRPSPSLLGPPTPSDLRTLKTLITLQIVLKSLVSHFAKDLFVIGLEEIINNSPPSKRAEHTSQLWKAALPNWSTGSNQ
jgi:hypothetical protein